MNWVNPLRAPAVRRPDTFAPRLAVARMAAQYLDLYGIGDPTLSEVRAVVGRAAAVLGVGDPAREPEYIQGLVGWTVYTGGRRYRAALAEWTTDLDREPRI